MIISGTTYHPVKFLIVSEMSKGIFFFLILRALFLKVEHDTKHYASAFDK